MVRLQISYQKAEQAKIKTNITKIESECFRFFLTDLKKPRGGFKTA